MLKKGKADPHGSPELVIRRSKVAHRTVDLTVRLAGEVP
jgi:hypothetical protein